MQATDTDLVSILIAAYRAEKYIAAAIDSALAQTYQNIEIVILDGFHDGTEAIVKKYNDPRIRYFFEEDSGVADARNSLLKKANGAFLTWLDSDDIYLPGKVAAEVAYLKTHPDEAAVYCDLRYFFDEAPEVLYQHRFTFHSGDVFAPLLDTMFITNTTFMMRKNVLDRVGFFRKEIGRTEDWDYFLRMAHAGLRIGFLNDDLVRFRLRWNSSTEFKNQAEVQRSVVAVFESLYAAMSSDERVRYNMEERISRRRFRYAIAELAVGNKNGFRSAWLAIHSGYGWRILSYIIFFGVAIVPSSVFTFVIKKMWMRNRKNHFIRVSGGASFKTVS